MRQPGAHYNRIRHSNPAFSGTTWQPPCQERFSGSLPNPDLIYMQFPGNRRKLCTYRAPHAAALRASVPDSPGGRLFGRKLGHPSSYDEAPAFLALKHLNPLIITNGTLSE